MSWTDYRRLSSSATIFEGYHALVRSLVHRSGWTVLDAKIGGVYVAEWPDAAAVPAGLTDGDFAVLRPPIMQDAGLRDAWFLDVVSASPLIQLFVYRAKSPTEDASVEAWDVGMHSGEGFPLEMYYEPTAGREQFLATNDRGFVLCEANSSGGLDLSAQAYWAGYLTGILPNWSFGLEPDPNPVAWVSLGDVPDGKTWVLEGVRDAQAVTRGALTPGLLANVPLAPTAGIVVAHDTGAAELYARGIIPDLYVTAAAGYKDAVLPSNQRAVQFGRLLLPLPFT